MSHGERMLAGVANVRIARLSERVALLEGELAERQASVIDLADRCLRQGEVIGRYEDALQRISQHGPDNQVCRSSVATCRDTLVKIATDALGEK